MGWLGVSVPLQITWNAQRNFCERYVKSSAVKAAKSKTVAYPFLDNESADKCLGTRTDFERCLSQRKLIDAGKIEDPTKGSKSVTTRTKSVLAPSVSAS